MTDLIAEGGGRERIDDYVLTVPLRQNYAGLHRWLDLHGADARV
jgi:hypothetical protein